MGLRKAQLAAIEGAIEFETTRKRKLLEQPSSSGLGPQSEN